MLKTLVLSGALLLTSTGLPLGRPKAPSATDEAFALTLPGPVPVAKQGRATAKHAERSIARAADGLFYVDARVNGKTVHFLVDTGSNVVVLTGPDAMRVGMAMSAEGPAALRTAGGSAVMRSGSIERIIVAGQSIKDVEAATVDGGLGVSLLGQSALSRLQSISFAGDRLDLN